MRKRRNPLSLCESENTTICCKTLYATDTFVEATLSMIQIPRAISNTLHSGFQNHTFTITFKNVIKNIDGIYLPG